MHQNQDIQARQDLLGNVMKIPNARQIKFRKQDLMNLLQSASQMLEFFAKTRLVPRYSREDQLWLDLKVPKNDWLSAAKLMLADIFSQDVLVPLEDSDEGLTLQIPEHEGKTLRNYHAYYVIDSQKLPATAASCYL